jgi:hypothetical protein
MMHGHMNIKFDHSPPLVQMLGMSVCTSNLPTYLHDALRDDFIFLSLNSGISYLLQTL